MQNWLSQLSASYKAGVNKFFILTGNVDDYVSGYGVNAATHAAAAFDKAFHKRQVNLLESGTEPRELPPYAIVRYGNDGDGFTFPFQTKDQPHGNNFMSAISKPGQIGGSGRLPNAPAPAIDAINSAITQSKKDRKNIVDCVIIVEDAELVFPDMDLRVAPDGFRKMLGTIKSWAKALEPTSHVVIFTCRNSSMLSRYIHNIGAKFIDIEPPDIEERAEFIETTLLKERVPGEWEDLAGTDEEKIGLWSQGAARRTAGLMLYDLENIILMARSNGRLTDKLVSRMKRERVLTRTGGSLEAIEPRHDMSGVDGHSKIKQAFHNSVVRAIKGEVDTSRLPQGILMGGPPGTGKTHFAEGLAGECGIDLLIGRIGSLFGKYVGDTEQNTQEFVRAAVAAAPCVLFIDEIDRNVGGRDNDSGVTNRLLSALLEAMNKKDKFVVWLAATNNPDQIDGALLRRFSKVAPFLVQAGEEQTLAVANCMQRNNYPKIEIGSLQGKFERYTGDEIQNIVIKAKELIEDEDLDPETAIDEALKRIRRATVDLARYSQLAIDAVKDSDWMPDEDSYWMPGKNLDNNPTDDLDRFGRALDLDL